MYITKRKPNTKQYPKHLHAVNIEDYTSTKITYLKHLHKV